MAPITRSQSRLLRETRCFLVVPREILFLIADQLPLASRVALALTSKSAFTSICPTGKFPRLDKDDLLSLLVELEKNLPDCFLCFGCVQLQPLNRDSKGNLEGAFHRCCDSWHDIIKKCLDGCLTREDASELLPLGIRHLKDDRLLTWRPIVCGIKNRAPEITFSEGRLIMNRHFFGEAYGLPIKYLERTIRIKRFISLAHGDEKADHFPLDSHLPGKTSLPRLPEHYKPWEFAHRTNANVINDELFLRRSHDISGPRCTSAEFYRAINNLELPICRHILCASNLPPRYIDGGWLLRRDTVIVPELQSARAYATVLESKTQHQTPIRSCASCFTDYTIEIEEGNIQKEWKMKLITWHRLGGFRSPDDDAWVHIADSHKLEWRSRSRSPKNLLAGTVRGAWLDERKTSGAEDLMKRENSGGHLNPQWAFRIRRP